MKQSIEELIAQFEAGTLTRRELMAALTAGAAIGSALPALAEDEVAPMAFSPRDVRHVLFARLANMKYTVEGGDIVPLADPLIFSEHDPNRQRWLFGSSYGLLSSNRGPIGDRLTERLYDADGNLVHEGAADYNQTAHREAVYDVASGNNRFKNSLDLQFVYDVMQKKMELVEGAGEAHLGKALKDWLNDSNTDLGANPKATVIAKIDSLLMERAQQLFGADAVDAMGPQRGLENHGY